MNKVMVNIEPKNGLHGTGPLNLHSPVTFPSTELICRVAQIETDAEVFHHSCASTLTSIVCGEML